MTSTCISVIIPVWNAERSVERCVESVCRQDHENLQIILLDDGSTDATLSICERLASRDPRIEVHTQINRGASGARNAGLSVAKGEYVQFVDADDTVENTYASSYLSSALSTKADIVIGGGCYVHTDTAGRMTLRAPYTPTTLPLQEVYGRKDFLHCIFSSLCHSGWRHLWANVWGKMYRRDFLEKNSLRFDEALVTAEDMKFNVECIGAANIIGVVHGCLYNYWKTNHKGPAGSTLTSHFYARHHLDLQVAFDTFDSILSDNVRLSDSELIEYSRLYINYIIPVIYRYCSRNMKTRLADKVSVVRDIARHPMMTSALRRYVTRYRNESRLMPFLLRLASPHLVILYASLKANRIYGSEG